MPEPSNVLLDQTHDQMLRQFGFVTFPLVGPDEVARLHQDYDTLHGWEGGGIQSGLVLDDPAYQRSTSAAIGTVLDTTVANQFVGHTPFLRNFLRKASGPDSALHLHQDWMYVDERSGARTYSAWVALDDIDGHDGQFRALRGSHKLDSGLRGTALTAPWLAHEDIIEERLVSIPVKAGDVVIFDNALVHSSFPNYTDKPRLVAAVSMRPDIAPLVHFRRIGEASAARYDVTEDFLCTATPQELLRAAPDMPIAETISIDRTTISRSELAQIMDSSLAAKVDRVRRSLRRTGQAATNLWASTTIRSRGMRAPKDLSE